MNHKPQQTNEDWKHVTRGYQIRREQLSWFVVEFSYALGVQETRGGAYFRTFSKWWSLFILGQYNI